MDTLTPSRAQPTPEGGATAATTPPSSGVLPNLSGGTVDGCRHYTLSGASTPRLRHLGGMVVALRHPDAAARFVEGREGVLHVLVAEADQLVISPQPTVAS